MSAAERLRDIERLLASSPPPREMSPERYLEAHVAFRGATNQQQLMLDWIDRELGRELCSGSSAADLSLLSVGCGSAIFDRPLLEGLRTSGRRIEWLGIDPNEAECAVAESALATLSDDRLSTELQPVRLQDFATERLFDLVYFVHAFYYFSDVAAMVRRAVDLVSPGGRLLIFNGPKRELNRLTSLFARRVWGEEGWSERLAETFDDLGLDYQEESLAAELDVTSCFEAGSARGSLLLDFIAHVDLGSLPGTVREAVVRYLDSVSVEAGGRRTAPHPVTVFLLADPDPRRGGRESPRGLPRSP